MESVELLFSLLFFFLLIYCWRVINPKLDWNYETDERLLWYNDPFDLYSRKSIVLFKKRKKKED